VADSRPGAPLPAVPAKRAEIAQLTGVRGIAAAWVVLFHFQPQIYALAPELKPVAVVLHGGYFAVDLFFVLSGYIIAFQYLRAFPGGRGDYGAFLVKRIARIYPVHLVTLALIVVLVVGGVALGVPVTPASAFTWWGALEDAALVRGWIVPSQGWNFPAWSLSAEWFAYLAFPAVALLVGLVRRRAVLLVALAAGCVALEAAGTVLLPGFDGMPHPLVRVMVAFVLGAALFALPRVPIPPVAAGWIAAAAGVALVVGVELLPGDPLRAAVSLVLAGVVVLGLARGGGPVVRVLAARVPEYAGRISYGVYMIHGIVLMVATIALGALALVVPLREVLAWPLIARIGVILVPLVVSVLLGAVLYRFVERPAQRWITGPLRRRPVPAASIDP
jgi:peptidoglycan/LPS O-acetylase OafA/YrhL